MTTCLIDADIVAYRCAASANNEPVEVALLRCDRLMRDIISDTNSDSYKGFISGKGNFRYVIYPEYKANRTQPDPIHRQACKDFLVDEWNCEVVHGMEADDALAIHQTDETILCSIDKDLLQINGTHYNFVKGAFKEVTYLGGLCSFYSQVLQGDKTDNLFGLDGIGPVKAARYLEGCETEQEYLDTVDMLYKDKKNLAINLLCMWMMREEGETWANRLEKVGLTLGEELQQEVDQMLKSMRSSTEDTSMVLI